MESIRVSGLKNALFVTIFKKALFRFYGPKACSIFNIHNPLGLKLLTRLRVNLSHLREHKFRHNFLDNHFVVVA